MQDWLLKQARKRQSGQSGRAGGSIGSLPAPPHARSAAPLPLWTKAVTTREGDEIVTRCCVVAGGSFTPIVVRVNVPALAAALRAKGLVGTGDGVGGFGSFLAKIARGVTHNAVTKAVGKVVTKVAKSPIVQIANPMLAISAHTISKGAGGKGTIKGPLGGIVNLGTSVVVPHALAHVGPKAIASLGIGAKAVMQSQAGKMIATAAQQAQKTVAQGKALAAQVKLGKLPIRTALPLIRKAVAVRTNVAKLAPKLMANAAMSKKVKAAISNVASKAKAGSPEARQAATAIVAAARMTDKISAAQQAAAGGNAGFVVTAQGKIRRAPKGKFVRSAALPEIETLYRGAKEAPLRGSFTAVGGGAGWQVGRRAGGAERPTLVPSEYRKLEAEVYRALVDDAYQRDTLPAPPPSRRAGRQAGVGGHPAWGGDRDPGDEMDGPFYPVRYQDPSAWPHVVDDLSHHGQPVTAYEHAIAGNVRNLQGFVAGKSHGWRGAPGTTAAARDRAKALLELARARHHLKKVRERGAKVGNDMAHLMVGAQFMVGEDVGLPPEMDQSNDGGMPSGALHPEIVGCGERVAGFPSYLFTRKGLHPAVVKRRFVAALKAMPPKMRRRVVARLRTAALRSRVSGAIRSANATIGSHWGHGPGWAAVSGAPGGYELVGSHGGAAGILTP